MIVFMPALCPKREHLSNAGAAYLAGLWQELTTRPRSFRIRAMNIGTRLIEALESEATHGDRQEYALRRLATLIDELSELPDASLLIGRTLNRSLEVAALRERGRVEE
jgi:hypothetical protein